MNAQKESLKKLPFTSSRYAMKMKVELEKNDARVKTFLMEGEFIGRLWKSSMMDRKEPQVDDY